MMARDEFHEIQISGEQGSPPESELPIQYNSDNGLTPSTSLIEIETPPEAIPCTPEVVCVDGVKAKLAQKRTMLNNTDSMTDSVMAYRKQISELPLMTRQEEVQLGKKIQAGLAAKNLLDEIDECPVDSEETQYLEQLVKEYEAAKREFIERNLRLVVSIARNYQHLGIPYLDLIQEGNIGLMHAVEKFDPNKGFKFSTYATWWIRQYVTRGVLNSGRIVRIPIHVHDGYTKIKTHTQRLEYNLGRTPTIEEVSEATGLKVEAIMEINSYYATEVLYYDAPVGEHSDTTIGDLMVDRTVMPVEDHVVDETSKKNLLAAVDKLGSRERTVIVKRYGLDGRRPRTLKEVGSELGLTREGVWQVESKAFSKLRHPTMRPISRNF